MVYEISRREVLNNLIRFKDNLLEMRGEGRGFKDEGEREEKKRKYRVLLNRKTGDMRFAQKITAIEKHIASKGQEKIEDWKEVRIVAHQEGPKEKTEFEVVDAEGQNLRPADLEPLAWKIASETIEILNQKVKEAKGAPREMLAEEAALADLSSIHLAQAKEQVEGVAGWMGSLSRIDAEKILERRQVGTYLIRQGDEITVSIAFHFSEENVLPIHPYLLTVVEEEEKISDILLLQTAKGWTFYHDDPNLADAKLYHYYPSLSSLLQSIKKVARYPLS